jgi:hypothetical protein
VDASRAVDPSRRRIGWLAIVVFLLTFVPIPFASGQ